tara:strand:- start:1197 stop:1352 length:156 start_codon:yes stop_codon:yes gene_type:complete
MAKKGKDWSKDRKGAFDHVFLSQYPEHAKSQLNSGSKYVRGYNKTRRAKGL